MFFHFDLLLCHLYDVSILLFLHQPTGCFLYFNTGCYGDLMYCMANMKNIKTAITCVNIADQMQNKNMSSPDLFLCVYVCVRAYLILQVFGLQH